MSLGKFRLFVVLIGVCSCSVYDPLLLQGSQPLRGLGNDADVASDSGASGDGGDLDGRGGAGTTAGDVAADATDGGVGAGVDDASRTDAGGATGNASASGGAGAGAGGAAGNAGAGGAGAGGAGAGGVGTDGTAGDAPCVPSASVDCCPSDPAKQAPGVCGCGTPDTDSDNDTIADCNDPAPFGWQRRLTLDGNQISGSLTNFPLLVRMTDADLRSFAAVSGSDIYFTAEDRVTLLDFEIESYSPATGALVAWVRVPSLSAGNDAALFLGYGDGKTNRSNEAGVWTGHQHVWHLAQDPAVGSGAIKDSTQRANGTPQGGMGSGALQPAIAGNGLSFDGVNDFITFTNTLTGSGPSTFSAWVQQAEDTSDVGSSVLCIGSGGTNEARFLFSSATVDSDRVKIGFYSNDAVSNTKLPRGVWKHLAWVWTGSQSTIYVDGAIVFGPTNHTGANTSGSDGRIGNGGFGFDYFMTGELDEVRIDNAARDTASIVTEFNNQRLSSTFIETIGAPEAAPQH